MKKIFLYSFLFVLTSLVYAENTKKDLSKMSEEELIKLFMQTQKKIDKSNKEVAEAKAKTASMKKETESAKKVNEKLDEILGVLEKDKK